MAGKRRTPSRDRRITVQGEPKEELDLHLLAQALVMIAKQPGRQAESPTEPPRPATSRGTPPFAAGDAGSAPLDAGPLSTAAREASERLVAPLGHRWSHVRGVAARAAELADAVPEDQRDVLVAAAWLHDIGYADELAVSGLHALDGARHLQHEGWPELVVSLVAFHTGATTEAEERGLFDNLMEFDQPPPPLLDALTAADMVTGPTGEWVSSENRVREILKRYGPPHPVHRAVARSAPELVDAVRRVEARTSVVVQPPMS